MNKIYPKIIIGSGGTGGHIYPGIAIAKAIKRKIPESNILFIGSKYHMEMNEIPKFGFSIKEIYLSGGRNKLSSISSGFVLLIQLIRSFFLLNKIIKKFSPNLVIGTGGFVSFPTLLAAINNKIPILIQEQNSYPGLTNRIFSRYANKICIAYEQAKKFFPKKKTILTGNPVRSEIINNPSKELACNYLGLNKEKPVILSLGGSKGSDNINNVWIRGGLKKLINLDIQLIWQIGNFNPRKIKRSEFYHPNFIFMNFIENISICYAAADVIISRAGALTISEICIIRKPTILVPLNNSSDNHQNNNAKILEEKKAILIVKEEDIQDKLLDSIIQLINDINLKNKMVKNMLHLSMPNATNDIIHEILQIISFYEFK
ncbi:undecaprenyldiphospho-muramoylpentapeptide beta-N-acetylglucosaminyltransferase [Blattabacterium cuenoti]|uniref:undecaprenyldiphospho-muramoylpentapeptide beta-N-acetylglucosaminyltransferase n=1 Tax=Blattabacterium cuenoti TaxID=1653831 RepID=UPI00163BF100|nr:undecaprenyldiphospho-muramoylpentapeptide beta-N-acetylglucosaminyltransferase [Blattabacterium cuenoti]